MALLHRAQAAPRFRNVGYRWVNELNMGSHTLYFAVSFFVKSIDALYWMLLIANIDPTVNYVHCAYVPPGPQNLDLFPLLLVRAYHPAVVFAYTADNVVGHKELTSKIVSW